MFLQHYCVRDCELVLWIRREFRDFFKVSSDFHFLTVIFVQP